ncbi:O-antigen ligase [Pacificibacter maritimus]|uniref:O-antigen ligase n=2 Tax=Pacificibacter maritimus TaxID=762213 RepID=A0A3N4TWK8_9RHOB|nr:O-antigen ligase [Pacificibacter maritimus]
MDFDGLRPQAVQHIATRDEEKPVSLFDFEVVEIAERGWKDSPRAASLLNDRMAIALGMFLFLVPVPYGANRPLAWLVAIGIISAMALVYLVVFPILSPRQPMQIRNYWKVLVPGLLAIVYAMMQLLPISFGGVMELPSLVLPNSLTVSPSATVLGILRMLSYALLFVLVSEVCSNRRRTERLLKWVFFGIVAHALWALLSLGVFNDTLLFQDKTDYVGYATGTFINRNSFATFMGMGMVIGVALIVMDIRMPTHRRSKRSSKHKGITIENVFLMLLVGVIFGALLASASRLGLFASLLGAWFTASALMLRTGVRVSRVLWGSVLAGGIGLAVILTLAGSAVLERLVFTLVNAEGRSEIYRQTLDMIASRPWAGFGLDSFQMSFELFHTPELSTAFVWDKPHNTYLTLWTELGVIAGSLPPLAAAIAFVLMIKTLRDPERAAVPAAAASGVIVVGAVHSLGDFSLEIAANTYVFVAIVALGLARRRYQNRGRGQ